MHRVALVYGALKICPQLIEGNDLKRKTQNRDVRAKVGHYDVLKASWRFAASNRGGRRWVSMTGDLVEVGRCGSCDPKTGDSRDLVKGLTVATSE